jgi:lipoprotein Spr
MNVKKITAILFIGVAITMTSCQSSQQLMEPKLSLKHIETIQANVEETVNTANPITLKYTATGKLLTESSPLQIKYASILGVFPQAIKNITLYSFVEDWYGVRYRFGGDSKTGIDCSAFARRLYEKVFCVNLLRTALAQFSMCHFTKETDSIQEGDLVFFKTRGNRITHVGVYLKNDYFVHASSSHGVMISSLNNSYWERRFAGVGIIDKTRLSM